MLGNVDTSEYSEDVLVGDVILRIVMFMTRDAGRSDNYCAFLKILFIRFYI